MGYRGESEIRFGSVSSGAALLLWTLIGAFLLQQLLALGQVNTVGLFALSRYGMGRGMVWQLVTYLFLHADFVHIFLNLLTVFFFGPAVEEHLGRRAFLGLFFACGVLGGLGWLLLDRGAGLCLGASAGVFGIIGAFGALNFSRPITLLLFFVLPTTVKGWVMAVAFGVIELLMLLTSRFGGVAYSAHLVGLIVGFGYTVHWMRQNGMAYELPAWVQQPRLKVLEGGISRKPEPSVDDLLDKIHREGMGSLTRKERQRLHDASRRARDE